jgi:hypothetical protein
LAVIVTFCVPPAVCDAEPVMTNDAAAPGPVGVTSAVADVRTPELKVKVVAEAVEPENPRPAKVAMPFTAETVSVPDSDPALGSTVTLAGDVVRVLPVASVIRTKGCVERVEPDAPATGAVTTRTFAAGPTTNETVSVSVIASELSVPLIVALPTVVAEVRVAVYVPEPA